MPNPKAVSWLKENEYSSTGIDDNGHEETRTTDVELLGLPDAAKELCGENVCIGNDIKLEGKFYCKPFADGAHGATQPCFDAPLAYDTIDKFVRYLDSDLFLSISDIREILRKKPKGPLSVAVNSPDFGNAYYDSDHESIIFGDGERMWHFASDKDIIIHESTHWVIDLMNPLIGRDFFGAGTSIHEGFADAMTALYNNDAQISEDFGRYLRGKASKAGVRTVNNSATFQKFFGGSKKERDWDPHVLGMIYSGFFWSLSRELKTELQKNGKKADEADALARKAAMKLILAGISSYGNATPAHGEFTDTLIAGAKEFMSGGMLKELSENSIDMASLEKSIRNESTKRGFDWMKTIEDKEKPAEGEKAAFTEEPYVIEVPSGERALFYPQIYRTSKYGPVELLGHGYTERRVKQGAILRTKSGIRPIGPGSIVEPDTLLPKEAAFKLALDSVAKELPAQLAGRTSAASLPQSGELGNTNAPHPTGIIEDISISARTQASIYENVIASFREKGPERGRLAILPKGNRIVWLFTAGFVQIAIDADAKAKTPLAAFKFNRMID